MTKAPRKSIVASFGLLSAELETNPLADDKSSIAAQSAPPGGRVGAGVIGAAHRAIDDIRAERDRLRELVESGGGGIKELDPSIIDPSPYPDRLPDDDSTGFTAFKQSIESEGQKVPIQVRKHPLTPGRYQIIYGHRRWLAARELGVAVRAIEVEISDADLVVAQGIENASRQDLSWIERTLFAWRMDAAGIKARNIYAALSIDDAELAKMRAVYRVIPIDILEGIGRAPKIGRPRWLEFAKGVANAPEALSRVRDILLPVSERAVTSDQRFQRALAVIQGGDPSKKAPTAIIDPEGRTLGAAVISPKEVRISASGKLGLDFLKYVERELPALALRFSQERQ
jgi:ParB family chromosome partitioning protein